MKRWAYLVLALITIGCAQKIAFRETPDAPAALGEAKVSTDGNNNTRIELKMEHLAPPQNLTPPKSVYVVWAQPPDGDATNLGQVVVGRERSANFQTVTPLKVFRIFVTAEDRALAQSPSEQVVLATDVFRVGS
jgi:hypothetical protein